MGRNIYITENQFRDIVNEMAYPSTFDMAHMLAIPSYGGRIRYCAERLRKIGQGSSRVVFDVDDEKVLKVAKNKKGIVQNEEESMRWKQSYDCFAKVYEFSDDGIFLEMQKARKAKNSDFKKLTGYDFDVMKWWIEEIRNEYAARSSYYSRSIPSGYRELFDSDEWNAGLDDYNIFAAVRSYLEDTQTETIGDMQRSSTWGVVSENGEERLVMVDFGLSDEIYAQYYHPKISV